MSLIRLYINSLSGLQPQVWLLSLIMLINRSGAMVVPFLSIYMNKELEFSLTQVGWVMASFGFGSFFGNYIGGRLVDKFGQYYQQIFSLIATGIVFLFLSNIHSYNGMLIGVFILALMADLFRPANLAAMSIYSNKEQLTRSVSLNRLAMNLGFTIGPGIAGWIAMNHGYELIFYVDAISCFFAAVIFFTFLKRKEIVKDPKKVKLSRDSILEQDPWYGAFLLSVFFSGVGFVSLFTSYPVYLEKELLLTEGMIGQFLALNGLIIFATEMPIVYFLEKRGITFKPIVLGMGLIGLALLTNAGFFTGLWVVAAYIVFITFGEIFAFPFQATFALNRAPKEQKGTYMGYYGLTWSLALMVAPPASFWIADQYSFEVLWGLLAVITLLTTFFMLFIRKRLIK